MLDAQIWLSRYFQENDIFVCSNYISFTPRSNFPIDDSSNITHRWDKISKQLTSMTSFRSLEGVQLGSYLLPFDEFHARSVHVTEVLQALCDDTCGHLRI